MTQKQWRSGDVFSAVVAVYTFQSAALPEAINVSCSFYTVGASIAGKGNVIQTKRVKRIHKRLEIQGKEASGIGTANISKKKRKYNNKTRASICRRNVRANALARIQVAALVVFRMYKKKKNILCFGLGEVS